MSEFLLSHNKVFHATVYLSFLILFILLEHFFPRRPFAFPRFLRVCSNISLAFLNNLLLYLLFPILALGAAYITVDNGWGIFQRWNGPSWLELILGVLALDCLIYLQHIAFHHIPLLWRLHRVHHADLELDVSTGVRFHTFEIIISMGLKIGSVFVLGTPPLTVLVFEILLLLTSLFNHSNLNLSLRVDRFIRLFIITPDVHRVHHSIHVDETNSNFGFNFPWWDRIFRTYRPQPRDGHLKMLIGIDLFRSVKWLYLHRVLIEPFINPNREPN